MTARHTSTDADAQGSLFAAFDVDAPAMSYDTPRQTEAPVAPPQTPRSAPHNETGTSRDAARIVTESGQVGRQERMILWALGCDLVARQGLTRGELEKATGIKINAVCGRVNHLVDAGLCREEGTRVPEGGTVKQKIVFITEAGRAALSASGDGGKA